MSGMSSLPTTIWAKSHWRFLHIMALTYPVYPRTSDKERVKNFLNNLHEFIPCSQCRRHLIENMKIHILTDEILSVKLRLILWVHDLHNMVNMMLGKKILSFEESLIQLIISDDTVSCCHNNNHNDEILEDGISKLLEDDISKSPPSISFDDVFNSYNLKRLPFIQSNVCSRDLKEHRIKIDDVCKLQLDFIKKHEEITKIADEKEQEFLKKLSPIAREDYLKNKIIDKERIFNMRYKKVELNNIVQKQEYIDVELLVNNFLEVYNKTNDENKRIEIENVLGLILECL